MFEMTKGRHRRFYILLDRLDVVGMDADRNSFDYWAVWAARGFCRSDGGDCCSCISDGGAGEECLSFCGATSNRLSSAPNDLLRA